MAINVASASDSVMTARDSSLSEPDEKVDNTKAGDDASLPVSFPEGGLWGWSAVAGGWMVLFVIFGSIGMYYQLHHLFDSPDFSKPHTVRRNPTAGGDLLNISIKASFLFGTRRYFFQIARRLT
jgi:hypothetical protein